MNSTTLPRLSALLLLFCVSTCALAQKIDGDWRLIERRGENPCAADVLVHFGPRGDGAHITYGSQFDGCNPMTVDFTNWKISREEVELPTGGKKDMKIVSFLDDGEVDTQWILIAYEKDYMRLQAGVMMAADGNNPRRIILKRRE